MGTRKGATKRAAPLQASRPATKRSTAKPAPPLRAEPGADGRKILGIVEDIRALWVDTPDEWEHPLAYERHERRHYKLVCAARAAARRIARRPVRSLAGVADLAVAMAWAVVNRTPDDDLHEHLARRLLAVGGLKLDDVDEAAPA